MLNQGPLLDDAMKALVNATYTNEEIKAAIWAIDGGKAPGPLMVLVALSSKGPGK